jgi:transposase
VYGSGLSRICREKPATLGLRQRIIACSWKQFSGGFGRVLAGSPWRDLLPAFGNWNSQFRRFRRWAKTRVFEGLFNAMSGDPDLEYALIDGTIVQVHRSATGAKGGLKLRPSDVRAAA